MRRKPLFVRTIGVGLCLLLFSIGIFAQTDEIPSKIPGEDPENETGAPPNRFSTLRLSYRQRATRSRFSRFEANSPIRANSLFSRATPASADFSSRRRSIFGFPSGIQSLLSTATGITQASEISMLEQRGLVSSSGQRPTSNSFTVDGLRANLGVSLDESTLSRNAGTLPALTAAGGLANLATSVQMSEITVKTISSAREQRVAGAEVNVATRSGNNEFHGTVFETFGSERLNANDFFANSRRLPRPPARLNLFGGALGGYLLPNYLWFHAGYEGLRLRQPGFGVSEVPNFSSRQSSPGALDALLNAFPLPNGRETSNGFAEFSAGFTNPARHDIFGLRFDAQPLDRLRLTGRYNLADSEAAIRGDRDFSLNTVRSLDAVTESLSLLTAFTPRSNIVIDGRVNFSRHRLGQRFSIDDFGGARPPAALFSTPFDFLKFDFAGKNSALAAGSRIATDVRQFQAAGTLDWILNRHQLSFGADFRRLALALGAARRERSLLFNRVSPNFDALTARVNELARSVPESAELYNFSLFGQENWRVNSRLNLNFGLRWDADFAPETNAANFSFQNASVQMRDQTRNFAPRASAAFDLTGGGRSILRGGAGLYFDYGNGAASGVFTDSFPFAAGAFARNAPPTTVPTAPFKPLSVFDNELQTPRAWHVFAEFQQEVFRNHIVTATYTYSAGRKLFRTRTFSNADPDFNYVRLTDNSAKSDFNALQIRFERRFSQGFSFNARYSLSKSKDNLSPDSRRETSLTGDAETADRGSSDFEARHQLTVYGVYDIPTFFAGGWAKRLTEDWSISAFANARTAFPLTVGYWRAIDFDREFVRADRVPGVPVYSEAAGIRALNPNAFTIPPANAQEGNLERNSLRGFPFFQLDASLQRRIRFTNEMRLELSINAFNVLNNTNFADMSGSLGTRLPNGLFLANQYFGRPTATFGSTNFTPFNLYGGARTVQLSVKFVF